MKLRKGHHDATGLRFGIVVARFNKFVTSKLLSSCLDGLTKHGVAEHDIEVVRVPGAFELPLVAKTLAKSARVDAVICLGAVIRGDTPHFDYISAEASRGIGQAALDADVPIIFGVLTTDTVAQAIERAEPEKYNDKMWFTRAFHHAARAIAYAAKRDTVNARKAQSIFLERAKLVPEEDFVSNNSCQAVLAVAIPMVEGEILIAEGKIDGGIEQLSAAIQKEDALKYDEPPGWLIPVRHSLGAVLMKQQRFAEAEQVLSRRSRAFARKRLVLIWPGRKFAEAKEKRRRSC